MASNTYNLNTWAAKRIIGDNSSASPESALLHNGGGRGNTAAGDTWIFYDDASGSGTPWGIKHDQVSDKISLFGNGTNTSWISLGTGNIYTDGKIGIGYDPGTNGNTYKLYVNGTGYFNDDITSNKSIWFGENSTSGKAILGFNSTYSNYGIWYFNESVDVMTLSASGNADGKTDADFGINVHGAGTLTNRNNRIPHTGNTTGTVGGTEQPVYVNAGTITSTSYALKATVNNSTAEYIAYYSADHAISGTSNARITAQGTLSLFPTGGAYRDGIRIHARATDNTWAAILLCGADNTGDSGTSANSWFIGNNGTGSLYLGRNGTGSSGTFLRCVNNVWEWNGTATGNISGNAGTATKLSNTPNTTSTFLRGDNTWTNELLGPLKIGTSDAAANTGYASANVGSQNYIAFYGVYGDNPGGYNHTYIGESIYGSKTAANEQSELLLFHGNDPAASSGPDRIRLFAGQVDICVYTSALSGTWDAIRANAGTKVANFANGVMTVTGNILPEANGTRALGSSTYEWGTTYTRNIYARHFDASQNYTSDLDMYYGYNRASNHYFYTMDGTTRTHRATISATGLYINQPAGNRNAGIIGQYDSTKAALIWTMGSGYNIKADGTTLGNLYGAAYAHTNATGALGSRTLAGGHQFLWCQNGGVNVALGSNIWTNGSLYITGADHGVYYGGSKSTERMIRFIDNTSGTDGNGMIIGGAGYMGIGSGESAGQSYSGAGYSAGSEVLVLSSDGDIRLLPTQQSGYNVAYETLITTNGIWVGKDGNTTREMDIGVRSGAGSMYMWAAATTNGARGIWLPAHGTGAAKAVFQVDTNNAVTFNGTLNGNASTATEGKYFMNRGGNTVTIADSSWAIQNTPSGHTNRATVFSQNWKQSGLTYTPSGGSATAISDTADFKLWLSNSNTANVLQLNMQVDGLIYAAGGFIGNLTGTASKLSNFQVSTTSSLGLEISTNSIGYVSGLTKGAWNYQQTDGAIYGQFYNANWKGEIFQDYRTGRLSVRGKNNGTWQSWYRILDEVQGVLVYNTSNIGNSSSVTFNDLAAAGNAVGMINAATDNPRGAAGWTHGISLCWNKGVNTSWISQIAISHAGAMYYRCNGSGTIVGKAWTQLLDSSNWYKQIFANKNKTRSTLTVTDSNWNVVPSGAVDVFGLSFKDTSLTADTGNLRMWISKANSNNTILSMQLDGYFLADAGFSTGGGVDCGVLTAGKRNVTTAPASLTYINRIIITPYFHTGGPWEIRSGDDANNAYLALDYGSSYSQILTIRHDALIGMPWGQLDLGAWVKNTARSSQSRLNVASGSGIIQLYANGATGGNRGCYVSNAAGTGEHVFYIDQSNRTTYYGKVPRAAFARFSGQTVTIDLTGWCSTTSGYSLLVAAGSWVAMATLGSLYLVSGIQRGRSYGEAMQIAKGAYAPSVSFNNSNGKLTITAYNGDGGWYSVMPIVAFDW